MDNKLIPIEYFPNQYRKYLDKALADNRFCTIETEHPVDGDYTFILISARTYAHFMLLCMHMGTIEIQEALDVATPKVLENIDNLLREKLTPSGN